VINTDVHRAALFGPVIVLTVWCRGEQP